MKKAKIYIAGKITGDKNYKNHFAEAERYLRNKGYSVVNPVKPEGRNYRWYIDEGLKQLMECDEIYMLDNWRDSKGANLEWRYAAIVGIPIHYEEYGERNE